MIDSNSITDQIHGHEVMKMMVESGEAFTRASLQTAILARFGTDTRFYTCSADNMTAAALIDFLEQRGKFISKDNGFSTAPTKSAITDRRCGRAACRISRGLALGMSRDLS